MENKYTIRHIGNNEFLREDYESDDAYTDDLGNAMIFKCIHSAKLECRDNEMIVPVFEDEEGCLSL